MGGSLRGRTAAAAADRREDNVLITSTAASIDAARLYADHHAELYRYLVRLTGDADLAADAAQETFTRLIERPPGGDRHRAWLFTVATNVVRAWSNRRKRRSELIGGNHERAAASDPPPGPDTVAESNELRQVVRAALEDLSAKERTVLLMREEGFSHREIADAVGTTTGSIGTTIARALDKLARTLPLDSEDL